MWMSQIRLDFRLWAEELGWSEEVPAAGLPMQRPPRCPAAQCDNPPTPPRRRPAPTPHRWRPRPSPTPPRHSHPSRLLRWRRHWRPSWGRLHGYCRWPRYQETLMPVPAPAAPPPAGAGQARHRQGPPAGAQWGCALGPRRPAGGPGARHPTWEGAVARGPPGRIPPAKTARRARTRPGPAPAAYASPTRGGRPCVSKRGIRGLAMQYWQSSDKVRKASGARNACLLQ